MTDLLYKAAVWKQQQRHAHATQSVELGGVSLLATPNGQYSYTDAGGNKIETEFYSYIFRYSDIVSSSIKVIRGLSLVHNGVSYEAAYDKKVLSEFDDPYQLDIIIRFAKR